jgi:type II secretory pathway component PulC
VKDTAVSFLRTIPTAATLAALVLAGWLVGRWVLYFMTAAETPQTPPRERVQLGVAAQALSDAHLFGVAPAGAGGEAVSNVNIKLKGVFASRADAPSIAIINTGDRDETARVGGEIAPGVVLEAVHPRHVMLRRNGALERVNLEEPQPIAAVPRAPARRAQVSSPAPQGSLLAPARGAARSQRPEPYAPVGDVPTESTPVAAPEPPQAPPPAPVQTPGVAGASQGLVIQSVPPGSLLERFGLLPGDVVRTLNGEVVTSEADVARILQSRGLQGPFTAEVQRGGVTVPISVNAQR